jgi:hypothetical protein
MNLCLCTNLVALDLEFPVSLYEQEFSLGNYFPHFFNVSKQALEWVRNVRLGRPCL